MCVSLVNQALQTTLENMKYMFVKRVNTPTRLSLDSGLIVPLWNIDKIPVTYANLPFIPNPAEYTEHLTSI